jgi:hypothetical protein
MLGLSRWFRLPDLGTSFRPKRRTSASVPIRDFRFFSEYLLLQQFLSGRPGRVGYILCKILPSSKEKKN